MAVGVALFVLAGCGAGSTSESIVPSTRATSTTQAPTTQPASTTTSPMAALRAWAGPAATQTRELVDHLQSMFTAADAQDSTELVVACSDLKSWAVRAAAADPAPDAEINTHWQRMIVLAGQMADTCIRGAASQDAGLIAQATSTSNDLLDEVKAMGTAIKGAPGRAGN